MKTKNELSMDYQSFKERLYLIDYNLESFCRTIGIAAITAKKWKSSRVPYRYVLLLEYMEMIDDMNKKYKYYINKMITKEIKKSRKISA